MPEKIRGQPSAGLLGDRQAVRVEDVTDVLGPRGPARPAAGGGVSLEEAERAHIEAVLREKGGDVRQARYPLATLHHCANYAAALAVLRELDPAEAERFLAGWRADHRRRRSLWAALKKLGF